MKKGKAERAMEHLDDGLIVSAMKDSDLNNGKAQIIEGRKKTMKNNMTWKKWAAIAAAFALVITGSVVLARATGASAATIALDVNPSIEIEINKNEEIKEIKALNEDAKIVIGDLDFKGVDLDVALYALIGSMLDHGYLSTDQNSILISIDSKNPEKANALKEKLSAKVTDLLGGKNIDASVVTQTFEKNNDIDKKADDNKISAAKATLIDKIVAAGLLDANGVPYTYETLATLTVNELMLILQSKNLNVDGVDTSGAASGNKYITAEDALAIAIRKAGLDETDVIGQKIEMDFDDDHRVMVYEVDLYTADKKYECEISAADGTVIEFDAEQKKDGDDRKDPPVSAPTDSITREKALEIAFADAGVNKDDVRRPEIELDLEKGKYVYEIEFKHGGKEYEYVIDASTGEVLHRESEFDD